MVSGVDGFDLSMAAGFLMDHLIQPTHIQWSAVGVESVYTVLFVFPTACVEMCE